MSISTAFRPTRRTSLLAGLAIASCACAMSLAPAPAHASSSESLVSYDQSTSPGTGIDARFLEALQSVRAGDSTSYSIDGVKLHIENVGGRLAISDDVATPYGVCAWTVASGLVLLGAAAIATIAVATAGAGGAIIAGQVFTTAQLWTAAGLLGVWGTLLTWVEGHICR